MQTTEITFINIIRIASWKCVRDTTNHRRRAKVQVTVRFFVVHEGIKLGIPKYPGFCIEHMPMSYTFVTKKCDLFKKKTNAINIFYELHLKMFKSFVNKNGLKIIVGLKNIFQTTVSVMYQIGSGSYQL